MFKMKLEGSDDSTVQNNDAFIENEQATEVNDQITDAVTTTNEDVSEEVNEDQNVLTFNSNDDILEYLKTKEDLMSMISTRIEEVEIPDDVKKYLEFREETGRGYSDFLEYQRDLTEIDEQDMVKRYMVEMNPEFDSEDVQDEFLEAYAYDEDLDDEKDIRKKTRAFKKAYADALEYFNSQKEKYAIPLGSNDTDIPDEYKSAKEFADSIKTQEELHQKQSEVFLAQTENLFTNDFKGFEFKIGDEVINHKPANIQSTKENQSNVMNFLGKFLDENGFIKDPEGYHKALYMAMNYESVLSNVYETARAKAIEEEVRNSKNIDMRMRNTPESLPSGMKFKLV
jgi:hypothetical protein